MTKLRFVGILILLLLASCSSFSVKTSTTVNYISAEGNAQVTVWSEGNIPGAGVQSEVPIIRPRVGITTEIGGASRNE